MSFITKNVAAFADNVLGIDRPTAPAMAPTNTAIPTSTIAAKNDNIAAPKSERSRSDSLAALGGGQSGIALDPLGQRGAGYVSSRKTLLGR